MLEGFLFQTSKLAIVTNEPLAYKRMYYSMSLAWLAKVKSLTKAQLTSMNLQRQR